MRLWPGVSGAARFLGFRPRPSFGRRAEILGALFLRRQGYLLLASPYRSLRGELDIVARDGDCLVFVEVKARRRDPHPEDAVNLPKRKRIIDGAREYLGQHPQFARVPFRFDVLAVVMPPEGPPRFVHYTDAFRAGDPDALNRALFPPVRR